MLSVWISIMVGSYCQSDRQDHPDPHSSRLSPASSTKRRIRDFFSTSCRSQTLDFPDLYGSFTRSRLDQLDFCSIATRSSPDQIVLRSDITLVEVVMIGYRSGKKIQPDLTRSRIASWPLLDRLATRSLLVLFFWHVKSIRVGSPSDAEQGRPFWQIPITHTDRARPVPDCLIELDRVDQIGSENLA